MAPMPLPPSPDPPAPARHRRAAVHHLQSRPGDRPVHGRRGRRLPRAERPARRDARRVAAPDHRGAGGLGRGHPDRPAAPFAVNQIVHAATRGWSRTSRLCVRYRVPIVITSLGARPEVNAAVHAYGGIVLHDVINDRFARKAIEKGADGLIAVAAGAGGHAGHAVAVRAGAGDPRNGSTARSRSRAPSPTAARSWPRRRWAPTSPISARAFIATEEANAAEATRR